MAMDTFGKTKRQFDMRTEIVGDILRSQMVEQQMMAASRHSVADTAAAPAQR
jgi:hypothetical protein